MRACSALLLLVAASCQRTPTAPHDLRPSPPDLAPDPAQLAETLARFAKEDAERDAHEQELRRACVQKNEREVLACLAITPSPELEAAWKRTLDDCKARFASLPLAEVVKLPLPDECVSPLPFPMARVEYVFSHHPRFAKAMGGLDAFRRAYADEIRPFAQAWYNFAYLANDYWPAVRRAAARDCAPGDTEASPATRALAERLGATGRTWLRDATCARVWIDIGWIHEQGKVELRLSNYTAQPLTGRVCTAWLDEHDQVLANVDGETASLMPNERRSATAGETAAEIIAKAKVAAFYFAPNGCADDKSHALTPTLRTTGLR